MKIKTIINAAEALKFIKTTHSSELAAGTIFDINNLLTQISSSLEGYFQTCKDLAAKEGDKPSKEGDKPSKKGDKPSKKESKTLEEKLKELQLQEVELNFKPLSIEGLREVKLKHITAFNQLGESIELSPLDFLQESKFIE